MAANTVCPGLMSPAENDGTAGWRDGLMFRRSSDRLDDRTDKELTGLVTVWLAVGKMNEAYGRQELTKADRRRKLTVSDRMWEVT